jgi:hypothetical protein
LGKAKKIDIEQFDLEELKKKSTESPGLISFPHTVGGAVIKPEDKGKTKGRALTAMKEQTEHQLQQLYDQMQVLVSQAKDIKSRVLVSEEIYESEINFEPIIGKIYFLYERKNKNGVLSMISPEEWGDKLPYHTYVAKVKLLSDHTWEVLDTNHQ